MSKLENAFALIIGVNHRKDEPLPQVVEDAKDIYDLLIDDKYCGYRKENVILITDKEATKDRLLEAFDQLLEMTNESSSILFFYSGHGGHDDEGNSYLLPYDYDEHNQQYIEGWRFREKLSELKSKRKIVLLDCCHAGGFFQGENKTVSVHNNQTNSDQQNQAVLNTKIEGLAQEIDDDQGVAIVTSCQDTQLSWAPPNGENSVFTQCLIEILKAEHQIYFDDKFINMKETVDFLNKRIPEISLEVTKGEAVQIPYSNLQMSDDFALSYLPKSKWKFIRPNKYASPKSNTLENKYQKDSVWRDEGNRLILFVHGFSGEAEDTFGSIPKFLQNNKNMDGWAMKPLGYSAKSTPEFGKEIWASPYDIKRVASYLKTSIKNKFKDYDSIAIIAHSLGGLVVQKALLDLTKDEQERISHLIMFSTPSNGIDAKLLQKNQLKKYKDLSSNGEFISSLRKSWSTIFKEGYPFDLKIAYATNDQFISVDSCFKGFDESHCKVVDGKHLTVTKPKNEENDAYALILDTLSDLEFYNKYTNKVDINITLGKYEDVITLLEPFLKANDIYEDELKQLTFAYEGLGRHEDALNLLKNFIKVVEDQSDFMGFLGGRYKRAYLNSDLKRDARNAIRYYGKGLKIAKKASNNGQIYYHAINLAFLSIVVDGDKAKMNEYATLAIEAANACEDDHWKFATLAEANIYVDRLKKSKEFYMKALENAGVRDKISMYTNAYSGYVAIKGNDEEDDFIEFLNAKLLS